MSTLTEIANIVKDVVRRPDLATLVESRVLSAISICHSTANCVLDRDEFSMELPTQAATVGAITFDKDIRTFETVFAYDKYDTLITQLEIHSPAEIGKLRKLGRDTNTCYVVNGKVSYKCESEVKTLIATGFKHRIEPSRLCNAAGERRPITHELLEGYHSWLMDVYDIAIIDHAVGMIENLKGNRELGMQHMNAFQTVHIPYILSLASGYAGQ